MTLKQIFDRTRKFSKINIPDMDTAIVEISNALISMDLLLFDELCPVLNMVTHKVRITDDVAVAVIRYLLKESDSLQISDSALKAVIERLRYLPQLQIDLEQGFKDGQLFVNTQNGLYDIMNMKFIQSREGFELDYICGFNYISGAKLSDAPISSTSWKQV